MNKYINGYRECTGDYRNELDLEDKNKLLYKYQETLPHLPIPTLKETLDLYLSTVKPLLSFNEYKETERKVQLFEKKEGIILQDKLIKRSKERYNTSYLAEWWNTLGYLQVRDPVVFNVSYFFHFSDSMDMIHRNQIGRAALLIVSTIDFRNSIVTATREYESIGTSKKTPICSTAYKYMFNSCRIPKLEQDVYHIYDPTIFNHVVVMRNNKFFTFNLWKKDRSEWLTYYEIADQLKKIMKLAGSSKESPIGSLSSQDRDNWANCRELLIQLGSNNAANLRIIESCIVLICLDDKSPISPEDVARELWHGNGKNRFYDKSIQLIVFKNAKAGLLAEHSMMDGMPVSVYANHLVHFKIPVSMSSQIDTNLEYPMELAFDLNEKIIQKINISISKFNLLVDDHYVSVKSFYGYGKQQIKVFKCSPDAFVQMAIQLAYYKLFQTDVATYEATQVRIFLHGRTETTRSCSIASSEWTKLMVTDKPGFPTIEKLNLLKKAIQSHISYMRRASQGKGVDRHLLGLKLIKAGINDNKDNRNCIFEDKGYQVSKYWKISTSHLVNEKFDGWGWGQVVPDGVGIAYSIKNNSCHFNIACRKASELNNSDKNFNVAKALTYLIEESLLEMKILFSLDQENEIKQSKL